MSEDVVAEFEAQIRLLPDVLLAALFLVLSRELVHRLAPEATTGWRGGEGQRG